MTFCVNRATTIALIAFFVLFFAATFFIGYIRGDRHGRRRLGKYLERVGSRIGEADL